MPCQPLIDASERRVACQSMHINRRGLAHLAPLSAAAGGCSGSSTSSRAPASVHSGAIVSAKSVVATTALTCRCTASSTRNVN
jgi:hypothetical protein